MQLSHRDFPQAQPRSQGRAALGYAGGRLTTLYQQGCMKILLPRYGREAVVVNTSGGLTGGDRLALEVELGENEHCTLTTQAAERVYRSAAGHAALDQTLSLGASARLDWLPQEMILFNASALQRKLTVRMAPDAQLLALESYVFGRAASGEVIEALHLRDHWRVWRGDHLLHAEALRLDGCPQTPATLGGVRAAATLLLAAPSAHDLLVQARSDLMDAAGVEAGVTSPCEGLLVARFLAPSSQALRHALLPVLTRLRGAPPPRVWQY